MYISVMEVKQFIEREKIGRVIPILDYFVDIIIIISWTQG